MQNRQGFSLTLCNQRLFVLLLLGFSSGLPLSLTSSTLQGWFTVSGIDLITIGSLSLVGIPYLIKFLWAPLLDRYVPPLLGRRRGWMLITQIALLLSIASMAFFNPEDNPHLLFKLAFLVAIFSASQDIAFDAYRTDVLLPKERGIGAAFSVTGYRIAMLVSGGLAFILADFWGWKLTYLVMAGLMAVGILSSYFGPEPSRQAAPPRTLVAAIILPFVALRRRQNIYYLLLLIVLYKLGDAFVGTLTTTFLLRGLDFSLTEVGTITKVLGISATLVGVFIGGFFLERIGLFRALFLFGICQSLSNLLFFWLAIVGKQYMIMALAIFIENLCAGMGTAAFVALLMSLCDVRYTAAQFALLSALASVGRIVVGPLAGLMVLRIGWVNFFLWTFIVSLPCLVLLIFLREQISLEPVEIHSSIEN